MAASTSASVANQPHAGPEDKEIAKGDAGVYPAVTVSVSKRKGTNAVTVAEEVLARVESLRGRVIPEGIGVTVTRNYGETGLRYQQVKRLISTVWLNLTTGA